MATMLFPLPNYHSSSNLTFPLPYLTFPSKLPSSNLKLQTFFISPLKRFNLTNLNSPFITFSTSHSSDQSPSPISYDPQNNFPKFTRFLTNEELERFQFLENYTYSCKLPTGYLSIRMVKDVELQKTVDLLAESFAESMFLPNMYLNFLGFLIKQYLVDRRGLMPYCATLIGFFREEKGDFDDQENEGEFAGTVEVSFDKRGANSSPPTPTAPKNCPYICNMTVKEQFRRRGIGWHLLKASEELISKMSSSKNVYLHCRVIDSAPFNMYKKAGYAVVKTDSFLVLLTLQRRKHLMCKELPVPSNPAETVIAMDEEEAPSLVDGSEPEPVLFDEVLQSSVDMDG